MSWFENTFLPSLFERCGHETCWLTRKQTAICTDNMERHVVMVDQFQGNRRRHYYYSTEWMGRQVTLNYSMQNGCGTITFGFTEQEIAERTVKLEAERKERELKNLRRRRERHTDLFLKELYQAREAVKYWEEVLKEDLEGYVKDVPRDRELLAEAMEKVSVMEAML